MFVTRSDGLVCRVFIVSIFLHTMYFVHNYHKHHKGMLQLFINKNHLVTQENMIFLLTRKFLWNFLVDKVDIVPFSFVDMVYYVNFI